MNIGHGAVTKYASATLTQACTHTHKVTGCETVCCYTEIWYARTASSNRKIRHKHNHIATDRTEEKYTHKHKCIIENRIFEIIWMLSESSVFRWGIHFCSHIKNSFYCKKTEIMKITQNVFSIFMKFQYFVSSSIFGSSARILYMFFVSHSLVRRICRCSFVCQCIRTIKWHVNVWVYVRACVSVCLSISLCVSVSVRHNINNMPNSSSQSQQIWALDSEQSEWIEHTPSRVVNRVFIHLHCEIERIGYQKPNFIC